MIDNVVPWYREKRVLILGCGNLLFGDDGFGPMTAQYIRENLEIPQDICVMDVETGAALDVLHAELVL